MGALEGVLVMPNSSDRLKTPIPTQSCPVVLR